MSTVDTQRVKVGTSSFGEQTSERVYPLGENSQVRAGGDEIGEVLGVVVGQVAGSGHQPGGQPTR